MHPADVITSRTSCYLVPHPREMSDHSPVAFSVSEMRKRNPDPRIPGCVLGHKEFVPELIAEFEFLTKEDQCRTPFNRLRKLKQAAFNASAYIRRKCTNAVAACTAHRLATTLAFLKAMRESDYNRAVTLQAKYNRLKDVPANQGACGSRVLRQLKIMLSTS